MKTLTICGSMRFEKQMKDIAFKLEALCGFNIYNVLIMRIVPNFLMMRQKIW